VKRIKSVEVFSDVQCKNCVSFNEGQCCKELPAISTEPDNRCGEGVWFFKAHKTDFRPICLELLPFDLVTDIDDVLCKNCVFYRPTRTECHFHRKNFFKSAPDDWCDNGLWLYKDHDDEIILVPFSFFYSSD
jgi:hypothetical protein